MGGPPTPAPTPSREEVDAMVEALRNPGKIQFIPNRPGFPITFSDPVTAACIAGLEAVTAVCNLLATPQGQLAMADARTNAQGLWQEIQNAWNNPANPFKAKKTPL